MARPGLMGLAEIAERLGINSRSWARQITERKGFPDPVRLKMGNVWYADEVERWIRKNRPAED